MKPSTGSILFKTCAVLFALTLSTIYIVYQWPDRDTPSSPDSEQPTVEQDLYPDMPDSAHTPGGPVVDLSESPEPDFEQPPSFDLNDALSKTGTIKLKSNDSKGGGGEGGLFGDDDTEAKE